MILGPVGRELDAWGPIVDRLASVAAAHAFGPHLTDREYVRLRALYMWVWVNTPVS